MPTTSQKDNTPIATRMGSKRIDHPKIAAIVVKD